MRPGTVYYQQVQQVAWFSNFVDKTLINIDLCEKSISTHDSKMPLSIMVRTIHDVNFWRETRPDAPNDKDRIITMMGEVEKEDFMIGTLSTYGSATGSYCPICCVPVGVTGNSIHEG